MEHHNEDAMDLAANHILCCECGTLTELNPCNMCITCLMLHTNITSAIHKQGVLYFCNSCSRYLQPPSKWSAYHLGSREFLHFCLRHLKGLNKLQLVDAEFIWTEPHSKRIKLKVTVQDKIFGTNQIQQSFVAEFIVRNQFCQDCKQIDTHNSYNAVVQIRQKGENKQLLFCLEQLILKHNLYEQILKVKQVHGGLDFQYTLESDARKMLSFITSVLPCRHQHAKKLMSHDTHSNVYNYKYTFSIEIVPITKHSIVCLPKILADQIGGINPLCLVYKITKLIHVIDPFTAQTAEISAMVYWKHPFNSVCHSQELTKFVVMDIEGSNLRGGQDQDSASYTAVDVWLVKAAEIGQTECFIHTKSHLGQILKHGDVVLGYAITECNINDKYFESIKDDKIPNVVVVKKHYDEQEYKEKQNTFSLVGD